MAATHEPQTELRFQGEEPPPPKPPDSPNRRVAAVALLAVIVVGALIATGFVLVTGGGDDNAGGAAAVAPASNAARPTAATGAATQETPARSIAVTLEEFTVSPQPDLGRAGRVTFRVSNAGRVKHEFVVLHTRKAADALKKGSEASEAGNVGEIGDLQPGASKSLKLNLEPGHYALICNLPGHYLAGQHADFTVR
jgi:uncharacterized cupredoxin-like copper-binding protein